MRYYAGGNIVFDLLGGSLEIIGASLALAVGLLWMVPAWMSGSQYFATPSFILDTLVWLTCSISRVFAAIVFPVAMLYSKYTTDSFNVFKGKNRRMVDSLTALIDGAGPEPATIVFSA